MPTANCPSHSMLLVKYKALAISTSAHLASLAEGCHTRSTRLQAPLHEQALEAPPSTNKASLTVAVCRTLLRDIHIYWSPLHHLPHAQKQRVFNQSRVARRLSDANKLLPKQHAGAPCRSCAAPFPSLHAFQTPQSSPWRCRYQSGAEPTHLSPARTAGVTALLGLSWQVSTHNTHDHTCNSG